MAVGQDVDSLRSIWQDASKPDSVRFLAFYDLVWNGYLFSDPDSGILLAAEMQQQAKNVGSIRFEALGLDLQAAAWYVKGDLRKALSIYTRSLAMHEQSGNHESVADVTTNMASMYSFLGAHDTALALYDKGLTEHQLLNDSLAIANDLNAIGRVYMVRGDHARAVELYTKSMRILEALGSKRGLATGHAGMGSLYILQGDYVQALKEYEASFGSANELNDLHLVAVAHVHIGTCHEELGDTMTAMKDYNAAFDVATTLDDQVMLASAGNKIAALKLKQGSPEDALRLYTEAARIGHAAEHPFGEATALIGRAAALLTLHRAQEALQSAQQANGVAIDAEDLTLNRDAAEMLYRIYKVLGKPYEALAAHERYVLLDDSLMREENQREVLRFGLAHAYEQQTMADSLRRQGEQLLSERSHSDQLNKERNRRSMLLGFFVIAVLIGVGAWSRARHAARMNRKILSAQKDLVEAERRSEAALVRSRIASDIHDDLGSSLTKLGLLGKEVALYDVAYSNPLSPAALRMSELADEANTALSDLVWATDQHHDSAKELVARAELFAKELCQAASIQLFADFVHVGPDLPLLPDVRHDLFRILKEILNNTVKHAQASRIDVTFHSSGKGYMLQITDNGRGTDGVAPGSGNGMRNVFARCARLQCKPNIRSSSGKGFTFLIEGSWPRTNERQIPNEHGT